MTDQNNGSEHESLQTELTQRGREVWLAGLGALATVEEEGSKLYNQLVNRGKKFESDRREKLEEASDETQSLLLDTVNAALERFGVPTRTEVDRLSDRVEALSDQVDDLAQALSDRIEDASESEA